MKSGVKRLFIMAAYDPRGGKILDGTFIYMRALSKIGDVVLYMDNDMPGDALARANKYTLFAGAAHHAEYDFGSYKRGFIWARDNNILKNYDFVYLVNDSVYAPLYDLLPIIKDLESGNNSAFGMVLNPNPRHPHIQSWFIGMTPDVFLSKWFGKFIKGVKKHKSKGTITRLYEQGFSEKLNKNNIKFRCAYTVSGRGIYNNVKSLYLAGLPFIKTCAFTRHNGALGRQILYVLNHIKPEIRNAILSDVKYLYGDDFADKLLTNNPFKIIMRKISYTTTKILKHRGKI